MDYILYFTSAGVPVEELDPDIITFKKVSDGSDVAPPPEVSEIGGGFYKYSAVVTEDLVGVVDGGAVLTSNSDRYVPIYLTSNDFSLDATVSSRATAADIAAKNVKVINTFFPTDGGTFEYVRGDQVTIPFDLDQDLTGKLVYLCVKADATEPDADAIINALCTITDIENGLCEYTPNPFNDELVVVGVFPSDVSIVNNDAEQDDERTKLLFEIEVLQDVRQRGN